MLEGWSPPDKSTIEVSVFGRGSGESIVVHLGDGRWMVVDSFKSNGVPIPLLYLDALGVELETSVDLVVASHWHDDHIQGLAETYRRTTNARMAFPLAMLHDEYLQFTAVYNNRVPTGKVSSGVRELGSIMSLLQDRKWIGVEPADAWKTVLRYPANTFEHGFPVEVEAMSPSNFDILQFVATLRALPTPGDIATRAPLYDRNDVSCALQVRIHDVTIVLAADLETVADGRSGWNGVFAAQQLPLQPASLLKIPHHGSITGDHPEIWSRLCGAEPVTSLTPWARGSGRLPQRSDVQRINQNAPESYAAARTVTSGDRHRLQAVNSVLKRTNSRIRNIDQSLGHVRHRLEPGEGGHWRTELFGAACELRKIAA